MARPDAARAQRDFWNVALERPTPCHLYWPDLDVDLSLDSIEHPERYPLKSNT
jgi:hypothetical protein